MQMILIFWLGATAPCTVPPRQLAQQKHKGRASVNVRGTR
jgi:hypothetical protein